MISENHRGETTQPRGILESSNVTTPLASERQLWRITALQQRRRVLPLHLHHLSAGAGMDPSKLPESEVHEPHS